MTLFSDDRKLVEAARRGDRNSFESLVLRYQVKMLNIAYRLVGDYDDACTITQDAFATAFRELKNFPGDADFRIWLTTITMNLSRQRMPGDGSQKKSSVDDPLLGVSEKSPDNSSGEDQMTICDDACKIEKCLRRLTPEFREVSVLRDIEGYSYKEIGRILKLADGTVKSRVARAREAMKGCLKEWTDLL